MQQIDGIVEKLKRTEENVFNLQSEISAFFEKSDYPVLPENDRKLLLKAIEYHKNLAIPPRFNVLAGEVIHHLRSSFDHIVWHFSVGATDKDKWIEFPVFDEQPSKTKDIERFKRKIERVRDPNVIDLIKRLQPYNSADPTDDPLSIIHSFDIIDKHRELILCGATGSTVVPRTMESTIKSYERAHPELDRAQVARHFKNYGVSKPCVSFKNFGRQEIQPVVQGLFNLFNYTVEAIRGFEAL
ncbi:MAG TPA: hypothetical protein VHX63_00170 [Acidobacteriaceae bacterium]|jgi:hypothetical protein|nr:hypothetical protein [Acidobacteriaceae bacterium]